MNEIKDFSCGAIKENFDLLADFMDKYQFSCADFLACVCSHLSNYESNEFETELFVAGCEFKIRIEKR